MMGVKLLVVLMLTIAFTLIQDTSGSWRGHYYGVRRSRTVRERYCICWYRLWGCLAYRSRWRTVYYTQYQCKQGYKHNGDQDCSIPICRPTCANGGTCWKPNICNCTSVAAGPSCDNLVCSYNLPCYPGNCHHYSDCDCEPGFSYKTRSDGCLHFDETVPDMYPIITKCTATLAQIRRLDNKVEFMFIMDATNSSIIEVIWSNQRSFNNFELQFESIFPELENLPRRPNYVFESGFGIVRSQIEVNHTKVSRSGSLQRDPGEFMTHPCVTGASDESPETDVSNCTIIDDQFTTSIEDGDWLEIKYQTWNGGFRKVTNIDDGNKLHSIDHYTGLTDIKKVKFMFDFQAPEFCTENGTSVCPSQAAELEIEEELTRGPIRPRWAGWTDRLSGVLQYQTEIFRLEPNIYGNLVEKDPLKPLFTNLTDHGDTIFFPEYTPPTPGIYSVLMKISDKAMNSRIVRRFVIYDNVSEISVNTEDTGKLFVSSAESRSDYKWQSQVDGDGRSTFLVRWDNHFINHLHENGKFLNAVEAYPIQFADVKDDALLFARKYVAESLDDYEGILTRNGTTNFHGIVKFEVNRVYTASTEIPRNGWQNLATLAENFTFSNKLEDGNGVRVWVKATDSMGNTNVDSTYVRLDSSGPIISDENSTDTNLIINYHGDDAKYNYTTRIKFKAVDPHSGIHEIRYTIRMKTLGKEDMVHNGKNPANTKPKDGFCTNAVDETCYFPDQTLDLDNCWLMVAKKDLDKSAASVTVEAVNGAVLSDSLMFQIPEISKLQGLDYSFVPKHFRAVQVSSHGFRVTWDLPDRVSCYGLADIVLVFIYLDHGKTKLETVVVPGGSTYFSYLGKNPNTRYDIQPLIKNMRGDTVAEASKLTVTTMEEETGVVGKEVVIGVAVGVLVLVAIVIAVFIVLIRRGHFQPVRRRAARAKSAIVRKTRQTFYGKPSHTRNNVYTYNARQSELYVYGAMEFEQSQTWYIPRSDITFEDLLKNGQFADIYRAAWNRHSSTHETVVAKTLKDGFTEDDEHLMKAKINFTANVVGDHPNVLKFIGAVIGDHAMGPFIIYEYCEQGSIKEYLQNQKPDVTVDLQEKLFRFGFDIAKGMEYLASKSIVHRRLAARNILLTFLLEVKIAGFGPQPLENKEDDDTKKGKRERVPIKWMAPECTSSTVDATEKSDVWSYGVVLWEIFTLGAQPYENIRSRDLLARLKQGDRLPQTQHCDNTWYGIMKECWALRPDKRPTFSDIRGELDGLFIASPSDDYYYYKP